MTIELPVEIGTLVTADLLNGLGPIVRHKTGTTSRSSTTTVQDDPELSGITLDPGLYTVEGYFMYYGGTTPDIKFNWNFTGSFTSVNRLTLGPATATTDVNAASLRIGGTTVSGGYAYGEIAASTIANARETFILEVTAAGDLSVQWAQNTSDATATTLIAGSYVRVQQFASV